MVRGGTTMFLPGVIERLSADWPVIAFDAFGGFPPRCGPRPHPMVRAWPAHRLCRPHTATRPRGRLCTLSEQQLRRTAQGVMLKPDQYQ